MVTFNMASSERSLPLLGDEQEGTQSIGRSVALLRVIASHGRRGMRVDEIVQTAALPKTTCVRVLKRLSAEGLVEKDIRSKKYFLGPLLYELGLLAKPRYRLGDVCDAALRRLADKTGDTVYLSERSGLEAVCTVSKLGDYPIKAVPLDVGVRRPLGVGMGGVAILARMEATDAATIMNIIGQRYEGFTGLNLEKVTETVQAARRAGYAAGPSYGAPGATSIGVPFPKGAPMASISVTALTCRMSPQRQAQLVEFVTTEIKEILVQLAR